jgi:hypothetical protein
MFFTVLPGFVLVLTYADWEGVVDVVAAESVTAEYILDGPYYSECRTPVWCRCRHLRGTGVVWLKFGSGWSFWIATFLEVHRDFLPKFLARCLVSQASRK